MSTKRRSAGGWVWQSDLPKGPNGRALCRRCNTEVPKGRRTFCGDECVHEWRLRTDPGYVRQQVFERDQGICAECGVDTVALRNKTLVNRFAGPQSEWRAQHDRWLAARVRAAELGFDPDRQSWWDADHIVPVIEGGGECGLENYRTLCQPCHKRATAELAARRAEERRQQVIEARGQIQLPLTATSSD